MKLNGYYVLALALGLARGQAVEFDSAQIAGTVTDAAGKPISGVSVMVNRTTGARMDLKSMVLPAITDTDGRYELTLRFAKGETAVVREVFAEKKGFVRAGPPLEIPLHAGEKANLAFSLK